MFNGVATASSRPTLMLPVAVQVPADGSYSSAEDKAPVLLRPPATRTLPLGKSAAVVSSRATVMLPVAVQAPADGP